MTTHIDYLGHFISDKGIQVDPKKIEAVQKWEVPKTVTQVQNFLGLHKYYRRFAKDFAKIATPLTELKEKKINFSWTTKEQNGFDNPKQKLTTAPILKCADPSLPYELTTDASGTGIGAVLSQEDEQGLRTIAYASKK